MAQYKLNWNYEPGVDNIRINTTQASYASTDYLVFTDYNSKSQSNYIYDSSQGTVTQESNSITVQVQRANSPGWWATVGINEQLARTYIEGDKYYIAFPGRSTASTWNAAVSYASDAYQLPKKTIGYTSNWVNTTYLSNTNMEHYQRTAYFIPINTNINLNEEFRTRLYNYTGLADGYTFQLPSTYYTDNTVDSFSYSADSIYNVNPYVQDSGNHDVNVLSRNNNSWIMNIPSTGTYHLYATYSKYKDTLASTQSDDIAQAYQNNNVLFTPWNIELQVYDPTVAKLLSTDLYTYRQQGYDYLAYSISSSGWYVYDLEKVKPSVYVGTTSYTFTSFNYRNDKTVLTEGLDPYQLRGVNEERTVQLRARLRSSYYATLEYGLSTNSELEGTDTTIAASAIVPPKTDFNLTEVFGPTVTGTYSYQYSDRRLYLYGRWKRDDNSYTSWYKLYIFHLYSDRLGIQAVSPDGGDTRFMGYPDVYLTTQVYYY